MWVPTADLPTAASYPFYWRLNQLLRKHGFDDFAEAQCASFYAETMSRPDLPPGIYFRLPLIGYFEGNSERGIARRAADSLALRDFLAVGHTPDVRQDGELAAAAPCDVHRRSEGRSVNGLSPRLVLSSLGFVSNGSPSTSKLIIRQR